LFVEYAGLMNKENSKGSRDTRDRTKSVAGFDRPYGSAGMASC